MADFNEVTEAETDATAFLRQALGKKFKDNFTNLNARTAQIEKQIRLFDHFDRRLATNGDSWGTTPASGAEIYGPRWSLHSNNNSSLAAANAAKPSFSVNRIDSTSTNPDIYGNAQSLLTLQYDQITKPIIAEYRIQFSADFEFHIGARAFQNAVATVDLPGIWLERVDTSNWRFVSYDTARNNGSSFTRITNGNWFKLTIEFTDTPSDRAICSIDDVVKATLTTQLPTNDILHAAMSMGGSALVGLFDIDIADFGAPDIDDAP